MSTEPPATEKKGEPSTGRRRFSLTGAEKISFRIALANNPGECKKYNYINNNVSTTKYTRRNFIFKNLYEQFSRMANIYFLVISVLTALPISPKDHISLIGTFVAVLMVSAAKEAYEDINRNNSDNETNNTQVSVINIITIYYIFRF